MRRIENKYILMEFVRLSFYFPFLISSFASVNLSYHLMTFPYFNIALCSYRQLYNISAGGK